MMMIIIFEARQWRWTIFLFAVCFDKRRKILFVIDTTNLRVNKTAAHHFMQTIKMK